MKKMVFIVEDNEDIRDILTIYLSSENMDVRAFADAQSFLLALDGEIPDLYLLDVNLPDGNGFDLVAMIQRKDACRNVPIIVMSAHVRAAVMEKLEPNLIFLEKPFDLQDLQLKILARCA